MAEAPITEHELDRILSQPMEIIDNVIWQRKPNNSWLEAVLKVKHPQRGVTLEIRLSVNDLDRGKYSFSLLLWGGHRIRGLDVNGSHRNTHTDRNRWNQELHKHKWTDICHGSWAYTPDDITIQTMEDAFRSFCKECGITFKGRWTDPPARQTTLFNEV
jgi:Pyruvate/2-oxoacid:ferredoxin oxidoreductase delta subunit